MLQVLNWIGHKKIHRFLKIKNKFIPDKYITCVYSASNGEESILFGRSKIVQK